MRAQRKKRQANWWRRSAPRSKVMVFEIVGIVITMHLNIVDKMENGRKPSAPPALDSAYLENKFQPELNVASLGSRLGQRHRNKIGSEADSARSRIDIWCLEIGMVEDVKELRPEL